MRGFLTRQAIVDLLNTGTAGAPFGTLKLLLFTAAANPPSRQSVLADFTEATFTGYVKKAVTLGTAGYDVSINEAVQASTTVSQWNGPSDASGQTVIGWALVSEVAGPPVVDTLRASGLFDNPHSLAVPTDMLAIAVSLAAGGDSDANIVD
jgi:hypothetical protein